MLYIEHFKQKSTPYGDFYKVLYKYLICTLFFLHIFFAIIAQHLRRGTWAST